MAEDCRYAQLRRVDVPALRVSNWNPAVSVGAASCHLDPDVYDNEATLAGEAERDLLIVLVWREKELENWRVSYPGIGNEPLKRSTRDSELSRQSMEKQRYR